MSLDYDLHVIDPENTDTTLEQFRDCIKDALQRLDERLKKLEGNGKATYTAKQMNKAFANFTKVARDGRRK